MKGKTVSAQSLRVGILGAGTVGAQVIRILQEDATLSARVGMPITVAGVLVRDISAPRSVEFPLELLTDNAEDFFPEDIHVRPHILVELIGGIEPARTLILRALKQGTTVVTANKALIAAHGHELYTCANAHNAGLYYEAAVAGAIPIIRVVRDSLAGDKITKIQGIVNGTTNYILDAMTHLGLSYETALAQAQELGYAEADPRADVEGYDAAAKCAILASLAFNTSVTIDDVGTQGITQLNAHDIGKARADGQVIKLIATAELVQPDSDPTRHTHVLSPKALRLSVGPERLPNTHPLASVGQVRNALYVTSENAGELLFSGAGAGGAPTASAVCADIVQAARTTIQGRTLPWYPGLEASANSPILHS